jgi:hypothetical protein
MSSRKHKISFFLEEYDALVLMTLFRNFRTEIFNFGDWWVKARMIREEIFSILKDKMRA